MIYTVILDYNDGEGYTYMTSAEADDPKAAADAARRELAMEDLCGEDTPEETLADTAAGYKIIAVIEGEHQDVYPHNQ